MTRDDYLNNLDTNWENIAPYLLDFADTIPKEKQAEVARKIRSHYFGDKHINKSTIDPLIKLVGDRLFFYDTEETVRLQAKKTLSPVYFYLYGYRAAQSFSTFLSNSTADLGKFEACNEKSHKYRLR